jgi:hypothetical protein
VKLTSITTSLCTGLALLFTQQVHGQEKTTYRGICDASAAVALGRHHFVVADDNDESNSLRIYRRGDPAPADVAELGAFLKADKEADLEGAAAIGTRIYWISSHGRNKDAEFREQRLRLFATDWQPASTPTLRPIGQPYTALLNDLLKADEKWGFGLAEAAKRAPEDDKGGLNIEGLASTADGKLLIGFRSPVPDGSAIVVPIENPRALVDGSEAAKFGKPLRLKLGGRGIRSIELVDSNYLIVAGSTGDAGSFALYRWSGKETDDAKPVPNTNLLDLRPEALFAIPETKQLQLLSDDGDFPKNAPCKKLKDPCGKSFGSTIIETP